MGLDVTAYRRLQKLDAVFDAYGEPIDPTSREPVSYDLWACANPNFPGRAAEIEHRAVYRAADSFRFRAGSYSYYNRWRDRLAQLAGYPLGQYEKYGRKWDSFCVSCWGGASGPFAELINFSDCEGTIGTAVSTKLANDFADFQEKANKVGEYGFPTLYNDFRRAFEMASDGGAVDFT